MRFTKLLHWVSQTISHILLCWLCACLYVCVRRGSFIHFHTDWEWNKRVRTVLHLEIISFNACVCHVNEWPKEWMLYKIWFKQFSRTLHGLSTFFPIFTSLHIYSNSKFLPPTPYIMRNCEPPIQLWTVRQATSYWLILFADVRKVAAKFNVYRLQLEICHCIAYIWNIPGKISPDSLEKWENQLEISQHHLSRPQIWVQCVTDKTPSFQLVQA